MKKMPDIQLFHFACSWIENVVLHLDLYVLGDDALIS